MRVDNSFAWQERINAEMKARREAEKANYINQSKPGWSKDMTWQELLDARRGPLNYE